jgi:hypothetical protein
MAVAMSGTGGDQERRERARDLRLRLAEQHPGQRDLDRGERDEREPEGDERPQLASRSRDRKQQERADGRAREHEEGRADVLDRDLDEQVRDAPDDAHRGEEQEAAARHGPHPKKLPSTSS